MHSGRPLQLLPVSGLPEIAHGDDLAHLIATTPCGASLQAADVVVIAQKIVSKAEGRLVRLADVTPSPRAHDLAKICNKDPRLVELVLSESIAVLRCLPDILIVQHRSGWIVANAGIDQSNIAAPEHYALLLPEHPDASAAALAQSLSRHAAAQIAVIINDSFGRPWRRGTVGTAIGCAGIEALIDLRGTQDRSHRPLRTSELAQADEIAAAASLVMGQAAESIPVVIVRGLPASPRSTPASILLRPPDQNLFV